MLLHIFYKQRNNTIKQSTDIQNCRLISTDYRNGQIDVHEVANPNPGRVEQMLSLDENLTQSTLGHLDPIMAFTEKHCRPNKVTRLHLLTS